MSQPHDPRGRYSDVKIIDVPGGWIYYGASLTHPILVRDPAVWSLAANNAGVILAAIAQLKQEIHTMSGQFSTDLAALTSAVTDLTTEVAAGLAANDAAIQALKDQIAAGGQVSAADLATLETGTAAIRTAITDITAKLNPGTTGGGGNPVFDPADLTPNGALMADGVTTRNTPGADPANPIAGYNPALPMTT